MKILTSFCLGTLLVSCAAKTMETPEGTYRWQRATMVWVPGKWIRTGPGVISTLPAPSPTPKTAVQ